MIRPRCIAANQLGDLSESVLDAFHRAWEMLSDSKDHFAYWRSFSSDFPERESRDQGASYTAATKASDKSAETESKCRRRRSLEAAHGALSGGRLLGGDALLGGDGRPGVTTPRGDAPGEDAWFEAWQESLECWWMALPAPSQSELSQCVGSLGLHLGSRFDAARAAVRNRLPGRAPLSADAAAEMSLRAMMRAEGCEWLSDPTTTLPEFPPIDASLDFTVPVLPRLLPHWQQHLWRSEARSLLHAANPRREPAPARAYWRGALGALLGAGAGLGLIASTLGSRQCLKGRARMSRLRSGRKGQTGVDVVL